MHSERACVTSQYFSPLPSYIIHNHSNVNPCHRSECGIIYERSVGQDVECNYYYLTVCAGERPFTCDVCAKSFAELSYLKKHLRCHTGERPHSCQQCGRTYARADGLRKHMSEHTGVRPYACGICQRRFNEQRNLKSHMLRHSGDHPFSCTVCAKKFIYASSLKKHMRTHTGEQELLNIAVLVLMSRHFGPRTLRH